DTSLPVGSPVTTVLSYTRFGADDRYHSAFKLDDVALWKRALSVEEIQAVRTNGIPGFISGEQPLGASFQSIQKSGSLLTLNWKSGQAGVYSLLRSPKMSGPWTVATNLLTSGSEINSFTQDTTGQQTIFYRISLEFQ